MNRHDRPAAPRPTTTAWGWALLAVAAAIFVVHALSYWSWVEDDAYISLRYAGNLVAGQGLVFNAGERVEGYSNLSWVLAAAAALKAGADPLVFWRLAGLAGGLAALILSWRLALAIQPRAGLYAGLAPFFLAATPILPRHSVSGLETVPYAALLALGLLWAQPDRPRRGGLAVPALLFLLVLTRPEGLAMALLVAGWRLGGRRLTSILPEAWRPAEPAGSSDTRALSWQSLWLGLLITAWLVWRWTYYGALLPNTFHAKMTGDAHGLLDGLNYTLNFVRETAGPLLGGLFLANLLGRRVPALLWPVAAAIAGQVVFTILAGGDWMHFHRFFAPVLPLLAAGAAAGLGTLLSTLPRGGTAHDRRRVVAAHLVVGAVLATAFVGVYKAERETARLVMPAVQAGAYLPDAYRQAALWIRDNTPPGSSLAASDVGALGWYSGRRIIDMFGLVDAHIARSGGRLHFKADPAYVLALDPATIVLVADINGGHLRIPDARMFADADFRARYALVHSLPVGFRDERIMIYRRHDRS